MINYKGFKILPLTETALAANNKNLEKSIINVARNSEVIFRRIDKGEVPIKKDEVPWGAMIGDDTIIIKDDTDKLYQYLKPHFANI